MLGRKGHRRSETWTEPSGRMLSLQTRILLLALALTVLVPAPAQAIIGGHSDGTAHPFVGLVTDKKSFCSGTLLAPTIFVTAAHCFPATGSIGG